MACLKSERIRLLTGNRCEVDTDERGVGRGTRHPSSDDVRDDSKRGVESQGTS